MNDQTSKYTKGAIYLHWTIGTLMIIMLFFGEDMIRNATGTFYPSLHASLGIAILMLTLVRLWWRLVNTPPALPASMKRWEVTVSHITHIVFYILMIVLPLSGWLSLSHQVISDKILPALHFLA